MTVPIPNSLIHRSCTCHFLIYQSTLYVMSLFLALVIIECFMLIKRTSHTLRCMHYSLILLAVHKASTSSFVFVGILS